MMFNKYLDLFFFFPLLVEKGCTHWNMMATTYGQRANMHLFPNLSPQHNILISTILFFCNLFGFTSGRSCLLVNTFKGDFLMLPTTSDFQVSANSFKNHVTYGMRFDNMTHTYKIIRIFKGGPHSGGRSSYTRDKLMARVTLSSSLGSTTQGGNIYTWRSALVGWQLPRVVCTYTFFWLQEKGVLLNSSSLGEKATSLGFCSLA